MTCDPGPGNSARADLIGADHPPTDVTKDARPCDASSVGSLRRWAVEQLETLLPPTPQSSEVVADAQLIVSELVTNGVRAGCGGVGLRLTVDSHRVRIEVVEDAPGRPEKAAVSVSDDHGRGLVIVDALSAAWGVEERDNAKAVWVELRCPPPPLPDWACSDQARRRPAGALSRH